MGNSQSVIAALQQAVQASPEDTDLRVHLAELLIGDGQTEEAIAHLGVALALQPRDSRVQQLMRQALGAAPSPARSEAYDWSSAESEVADIVRPAYVEYPDDAVVPPPQTVRERPTLRLSDVGGMTAVKQRLQSSFFLPLRNPELSKLYNKSLRGGLLLYGPPGCGKTYIARAIAGELGASFLSISISDILDPMFGQSEQNVHEIFQYARRESPCVLFIDEVDALGQRRNSSTPSLIRGVVNQILTELDGVSDDNDGVYVLAATNQPWDVDPALRRPGRFDRTMLVSPPDEEARVEIFRRHLEDRPIEGIELVKLARMSEGRSGADIAYACELAAEKALESSISSGNVRMIEMDDLTAAIADVPPSTSAWLGSARNFITYGLEDPAFEELRQFLKKSKRL